jgi:hypothetical protein
LYVRYLFLAILVFSSILLLKLFFRKPLPDISNQLINILLVEIDFQNLKGFVKNLWFLRTYLTIIIVLPIFAFWRESLFRNVCLSILSISIFIVLSSNSSVQIGKNDAVYATFYATFFFIGSIFRLTENKIKLYPLITSFAFLLFAIWLLIHRADYKLMIQSYKFPPSLRYFLFSLPYIYVFILFKCFYSKTLIKLPAFIKKGLMWSSSEVFEIYLIQSLVCSLPYYFVPKLKDLVSPFHLYIAVLTFNFTLTVFFVWFYKHLRSLISFSFSYIQLRKRIHKIYYSL